MSGAVFTPDTIDLFGWTLIHFLWQGTALALLLYVFAAFTRKADLRYAAGLITLGLMMAAPPITFYILASKQTAEVTASNLQVALRGLKIVASSATGIPIDQAAHSLVAIHWIDDLVWLWIAGVVILSLRALGGYVVLQRMLREKCTPLAGALRARCAELEASLGIGMRIRYLQSSVAKTPAAVGWLRPVVLLPITALSGLTPAQLEAVIVHELAHIKRFDCLINVFQIFAETVLFYHPAVWWVNRFVRHERENCCDDVAVELSGDPGNYARALALMEGWRSAPAWALGVNGGVLKARVGRILGLDIVKSAVPQGGLAMIGCLCVAGAILSAATLGHAFAGPAQDSPAAPVVVPTPPAAPTPAPVMPRPTVPAMTRPAPVAVPTPPAPPEMASDWDDKDEAQAPDTGKSHDGSYIDALKAAGVNDLSVDKLIALKIQGVTPEYVKAMRAAGFDASAGELIAMKVQGVSADYVKRVRAAGWRDISTGQLIAMKVQDIDPAQAAEFKREFGFEDFSFGQMMAFQTQGITPAYVRGLRSAGFKDLSTGQIIAAKVQGITPEFLRKVRKHGFSNLSLHQLIALKVAGVF